MGGARGCSRGAAARPCTSAVLVSVLRGRRSTPESRRCAAEHGSSLAQRPAGRGQAGQHLLGGELPVPGQRHRDPRCNNGQHHVRPGADRVQQAARQSQHQLTRWTSLKNHTKRLHLPALQRPDLPKESADTRRPPEELPERLAGGSGTLQGRQPGPGGDPAARHPACLTSKSDQSGQVPAGANRSRSVRGVRRRAAAAERAAGQFLREQPGRAPGSSNRLEALAAPQRKSSSP